MKSFREKNLINYLLTNALIISVFEFELYFFYKTYVILLSTQYILLNTLEYNYTLS